MKVWFFAVLSLFVASSAHADGCSKLLTGVFPAAQATAICNRFTNFAWPMSPSVNASAYPLYVQPTITEASSGTHPLFAGAYFAVPQITAGAASVTDAATLYVGGAPNASGASNRSLYVYSGNSVVRDKLGVGAVTTPDGTLTVYGPGDTNPTAHFRTSNVPAPYGLWLEEANGATSGYPLLYVTDYNGATTYFRIDHGGAVSFGKPVNLKSYTVATLPAGTLGDIAYVTDATTPTYLGALVGGGAVKTPVFFNGSAWVSY